MLDSRFLPENLPFFPAALLWMPPSSVKPRPGVRRQSSRPWRVSSFHFRASPRKFSGPVFSGLSCTQPGGTGCHFLRVGGYLIYRGLQLWGLWGRITWRSICLLRPILSSWRFWRATELSLDWLDEPRESQSSKLDERFLSGSGSCPTGRKLPFFPDLHHKVSRSWKQPFSSRLTNAAATDFTNLIGSVEQGYATVPAVEDKLAAHLSPNSSPSWKTRPLHLSKPCMTTSALIGKSYMAVGQAVRSQSVEWVSWCIPTLNGLGSLRSFRFVN